MTASDFREALETACLDGLIDTEHGYRYRPSVGADAVLALLAERLDGDEVEMAAAKAICDERRHRWDQVHQGECITDARAALAAVRAELGVPR
jgi:hypothetical protein